MQPFAQFSHSATESNAFTKGETNYTKNRTCHENGDEGGSERAAACHMQTLISPSWGLLTPSKSITSFFPAFPMNCTSSPRMHSPRALSEPRSREPKPTPNCRTVKRPPHATAASIEALVPDCAMMPRLPTHSYLVMPMPKSSVVMTRPPYVLPDREATTACRRGLDRGLREATTACRFGLHRHLGARLRDDAQVAGELVLCHADAEVFDGNDQTRRVGDDPPEKVPKSLDVVGVGEELVADDVQHIRRVPPGLHVTRLRLVPLRALLRHGAPTTGPRVSTPKSSTAGAPASRHACARRLSLRVEGATPSLVCFLNRTA